jgi:arylsulfatase A-like enzyme
VFIAAGMLFGFGLPGAQGAASDKPNILFIMVDDLGKDWIGCYGGQGIETPHIDALAQSGLKFRNAYSMPQCTPTRATLLTGQYPWRTGWVNHWDVPRWGVGYFDWEHYRNFATVMKSAGYTTAIAGKWQINDFRLEPEALRRHGFDDWCVWTGYESGNPPSAERYWDAYIHTKSGSRSYPGEFGPDVYCQFLIDFMRRNRNQPMMLYWPMALTHSPLVATPGEPQARGLTGKLKAMVRHTDQLIGRMVAALEELGLRERTIIVFTTDNGTAAGVLGTVGGRTPSGGKGSNFEGGVCQPFIVNCPGLVPAGGVTDALTDFSDLLPTFAELGGATLPEGLVLDGKSIAPVIRGDAPDSSREWILAMGYGPAKLDADGIRGRDAYTERVIRDKRFKVWVNTRREIAGLFDLQADPYEQRNLLEVSRPEYSAALAKFQAVIDSMPEQDFRPRYRPRKANPWDKAPDGSGQSEASPGASGK